MKILKPSILQLVAQRISTGCSSFYLGCLSDHLRPSPTWDTNDLDLNLLGMGAGWCPLRAESEYGKTRTKLFGQPHDIVRSKNKVPAAWASLGVLNCLEAIFFYRMLCVVMLMFSPCCLVPNCDLAIHCSKQQLRFLPGVAYID